MQLNKHTTENAVFFRKKDEIKEVQNINRFGIISKKL